MVIDTRIKLCEEGFPQSTIWLVIVYIDDQQASLCLPSSTSLINPLHIVSYISATVIRCFLCCLRV